MEDKKLELYQALLAKKKERGLKDLYFFNKYILEEKESRRKMLVPHVHGEWADWFETSSSRINLLLVPRGTFKSSFFTVGWSLQQIAKNRSTRGLIANATLANAQRFLGDIKNRLRNNKNLSDLYGKSYDKNLKWNEDEIEVVGRGLSTREPTITATGVGGNLVSQHYDWIVADDLVNSENSATRYQSEKVIDWWKKSLSLLEPNGTMLVIGTRWTYYELYSYLLDELGGKINSYIRGAYNEDGSFYFPERYNEEKLKELKELHGSYLFSSFYLNSPVDKDSALIKKSDIKYYQGRPEGLNVFSACDPAFSQQSSADHSAIVTVGVDEESNWYVLEVRRGRWTVSELIDNLFSVYNRFAPIGMSIEVVGQSQGILSPILKEEETRGQYLPLTEIKARPPLEKETRIRAELQPRFEGGKVFIKKNMEELETELLQFPNSKYDDVIDCLADIATLEFPAESSQAEEERLSGMESRLRAHINKQEPVDEIMGENW
jgi:predicted phage terminase large subunit-like protein